MLRWLNVRRIIKCSQLPYSTVSSSAVNMKTGVSEEESANEKEIKNVKTVVAGDHSKLVAAAFASLKELSDSSSTHRSYPFMDKQIVAATDVDSLLSVADTAVISRHHALRIVSILADWASSGRIKLSEFDTDLRFAKLCRILGKHAGKVGDDMGDLSVVLGVTADDQAAKLISSISLSQMVKIISSLSTKKRRSITLLRSLSFNIGRSTENLNLKQAADVLFACADLNFPDEILLEKVSNDICACIKENKKASVVGSIITSIGILRYKDKDLLEVICNWIIENSNLCRVQEFVAILMALASVNYKPENFLKLYKIMKPNLKESEMNNRFEWIGVVWSLIVLEHANEAMINSVISNEFVSKLKPTRKGDINVAVRLKLLNINGYAQQLGSSYKGSLLDTKTDFFKVPLARSKEKQFLVDSVVDTISNLTPGNTCVIQNTNLNCGFLLDGEFYLDEKNVVPVPLNEKGNPPGNGLKVALLVSDYHDVCRGCHSELTGIAALAHRLTAGAGYKVLSVPYTEYRPRDKLITRVQYVQEKLRELVTA